MLDVPSVFFYLISDILYALVQSGLWFWKNFYKNWQRSGSDHFAQLHYSDMEFFGHYRFKVGEHVVTRRNA